MQPKYILGLALTIFGFLLLITNIGIVAFDFGDIFSNFWPLILVFLGFNELTKHKKSKLFPYFMIFIGILLQIHVLDIFPFDFWQLFWPLSFIGLGIWIILNKNKKKNFAQKEEFENYVKTEENPEFNESGYSESDFYNSSSDTNFSDDTITISSIFAGVDKSYKDYILQKANLDAIFGGIKLDFRNADVAEKNLVLSNAIFGGIEIYVPNDWKVVAEGEQIFGSFEDKTYLNIKSENEPKKVFIRYSAVFGGIVIRN